MTSSPDASGALEAVERILNLGGDADDVLRHVVGALHERFLYAAIRFVEGDALVEGPSAGDGRGLAVPVEFQGSRVAELEVASDDEALVRRIALLISPYCLVGWDTGGEGWAP